jgi:hypothetical protein
MADAWTVRGVRRQDLGGGYRPRRLKPKPPRSRTRRTMMMMIQSIRTTFHHFDSAAT